MLNYRDPLFSIILFLVIILIVLVITNILGYYKEKNKKKYIQEFIEKFDFLDDEEINSIFSDNISQNALELLAIAFEKEGNYEKSLNIYLILLKHSKDKFKILQHMAEVYFKAGFLQKARESLLEILRSKPRDKKALKLLLVVDDKLKNYDEIENIIEIFETLDEDIKREKAYFEFQKAIFNNDKKALKKLLKQYPFLKRKFVEYFIHTEPEEAFKKIEEQDIYQMLDIFWNIDDLPLRPEFVHIQAAKKKIKTPTQSPIFELEVLKYTPKNLADLEFEYICGNCKQIFPFYHDRCPNCKELFCMELEARIVKKT